ncbi:hypothetical protein F2Q70_00018804 [Brassica cretica]|uniref:Pyruvate carboxyltransferase domain-containing protein n=1 Tax=Brassica cretica TaxID=69181 RepID=A0A8S9HRX6_BRACR|nr:hypothetical protein F2Q70_00018804 [Brassica cretica]
MKQISKVIQYIHFLQEKVDKHEPPEGTVPVLAEAQAVDMEHQQYLKRAMDTTSFPVLGQRNSFFSPELSQLCPVSTSDVAAMECENLREEEEVEELSIHNGTINISSVYSQGLLKTLSETLQTSGVDLSRSRISVQIKLSKQPQEVDEETGYIPVICVIARSKERDIKAAWESVKYAKRPRIVIFTSTSDIHLKYKLKMTREEVVEMVASSIRFAKSLGFEDIEFGCEDGGRFTS